MGEMRPWLATAALLVASVACGGEPRPSTAPAATIGVQPAAPKPLEVVDAGTSEPSSVQADHEELTYEEAIELAARQPEGKGKGGPELTDAQLSSPTHDTSFITKCNAPNDTKVTVRVVVHRGRAKGLSILTKPPVNLGILVCLSVHVRNLRWPKSSYFDSFTITY